MHLTLFFTRGVSLQTWDSVGMLEREVALYQQLQKLGVQVSFITYGNKKDLQYESHLNGIRVFCNYWNLPRPLYEKLIRFLHASILKKTHVIKSNQINGADVALQAAHFWRKPFIARGGYLYSMHTQKQFGATSSAVKRAVQLEKHVYLNAYNIIVTAPFMKEYIQKQYNIPAQKITIIPNYVNTDLFCPAKDKPENERHLCFIGRLEEQKNVAALLAALQGLDATIDIIGNGSLLEELKNKAAEVGVSARFWGNLPHSMLPETINRAALYVQPSLYEGHPKTILEAMACGKAVIGGDSPGIREVIQHGVNGWLCGTSPEEIRHAVSTLLKDAQLRDRLGENARLYVEQHCSLERVVEMECSLYRKIVKDVSL